MLLRYLTVCLAVVALAALILLGTPVAAEDKDSSHQGTVVSVSDGKLTMKVAAGKEHTLTVAANAKITCNGKACKLVDLKKGFKLKVTPKKGDEKTALRIEAKTK